MGAENMLVIAVDGLRAAALGAYGNTTYPTPSLDEFAAQSLLFDWCFVDSADLATIYGALWGGNASLAKSLIAQGYASTLVIDDPAVASIGAAAGFDETVQVADATAERADDVAETAFARIFAATSELLESSKKSQFVWVHSRGMHGPWDAPLELQEPLLELEEGDPPPTESVTPPDFVLDKKSDPDTAFRWSCAYAAEVMALDACFGELLQSLDQANSAKWQVVLCGVRGFPLGEHQRVGGVDERLHVEQLHVPLIWRHLDGSHRLARNGVLASLADLPAALLAHASDPFHWPERDALFAASPSGARVIRTTDWTLRTEPQDSSEDSSGRLGPTLCELYVRPDDRWEANDVANLCSDVVDDLLAKLAVPPPI
jgi:membrane-anchored protein YejM (alkaline phosphatase superfamily)